MQSCLAQLWKSRSQIFMKPATDWQEIRSRADWATVGREWMSRTPARVMPGGSAFITAFLQHSYIWELGAAEHCSLGEAVGREWMTSTLARVMLARGSRRAGSSPAADSRSVSAAKPPCASSVPFSILGKSNRSDGHVCT